MTLEEIKKSDKDILYAGDIYEILHSDPNVIRFQAHEDPSKLLFPVIVLGRTVKIPKKPFIEFCEKMGLGG